ncbi:hypothetical protein ADL35_11540, partial [Streptomyces sp. NRRL WC-3753]
FTEAERHGVATPVLRAVIAQLRELERDPGLMTEARLDALDRLASDNRGGFGDTAAPDQEQAAAVRAWLTAHREEMVADLAEYTSRESASDDLEALDACLAWVRHWLDGALGAPAHEEIRP